MTCRAMLTTYDGHLLTCDQASGHPGTHSAPLTRVTGRIQWTYQHGAEQTEATS